MKTKMMIRICKVQTIRERSLNQNHSKSLLLETFIDDSTEDVSSPQNNYRSESERTADSEHIGSYYEDLLTRVYSSVHRAGGNLPRHSSNNTESIIRHRGADDMPMWRVKCRVSSLLNILGIFGRDTQAISSRLGWRKYW